MSSGVLDFWQHLPSHMNPVLVEVGGFSIRWYGLMYIAALASTYKLAAYRVVTETRFHFNRQFLKDLMTYAFIGILVGGRIGYAIFYNFVYYIHRPWEIVLPFRWEDGLHFTGISGMSFHGGLAGALIASAIFCRKRKADFLEVADLICPVFPIGYTLGRLGNFINGELYGRITQSGIGMYFPTDPAHALRYPSQLFEAFFEGVILFVVLWNLRRIVAPKGFFLAAYTIGYGFIRFFLEYYRQPDEQLGFVFHALSMGQVLCILMASIGVILMLYFFSISPIDRGLPRAGRKENGPMQVSEDSR